MKSAFFMRRSGKSGRIAALLVAVSALVGGTIMPAQTATAGGSFYESHFLAQTGSTLTTEMQNLGFDLADITASPNFPATTSSRVNALPSGARAIVWVGNLGNTNCTPGFSDAQFQANVLELANNPRMFAWYLSDEPHPANCANGPAMIAARADFIHEHAPGQKAFIVVQDGDGPCGVTNNGCEYSALAPSVTHVDYVGIDPYPCHYSSTGVAVPCELGKITQRYNSAIASGIPAAAIVPVFQTFGQEGRTDGKQVFYRTPTISELRDMYGVWGGLITAAWDMHYLWGVQCTASSCPAPQAIANHAELKDVVAMHNYRYQV